MTDFGESAPSHLVNEINCVQHSSRIIRTKKGKQNLTDDGVCSSRHKSLFCLDGCSQFWRSRRPPSLHVSFVSGCACVLVCMCACVRACLCKEQFSEKRLYACRLWIPGGIMVVDARLHCLAFQMQESDTCAVRIRTSFRENEWIGSPNVLRLRASRSGL